ncbi:MAG: bifunctional diaminohydroxyphosphoribosylaminopyrimidine deaminase/5-amino-6-(5-phosphoribosylamino)uracil reductase RibD [Clostridiales bacterium]|nr:bifunctional diaminohydroxyphosphoribosylaminopyrimidine deaminase/5-amino-6-(5-phosphoribosylamino)uracil reductase RibD [Clostridiales bacterium]
MESKYMKRALELAEKGSGFTSPNPLVGAVIVKDGMIIGEGYHEFYGGPHAEINAFKNVTDDVRGATMYVTLEPCSHFGKTPPCANAIIEKGISKVVIGMIDPNPVVAGRGVSILRESGIEVHTGVLEEECKKLNEIFIKYITTKKPFVILKSAMTLDGKIATSTGDSKWITSEASRTKVHEIRQRVAGILVGIGTVLADDPYLTTRLMQENISHPVRVIVDTHARTPLDAHVLEGLDEIRTIIATTSLASDAKLKQLKEIGAEILLLPIKDDHVDLEALIVALGEIGIDSVLIEGGSKVNFSAIEMGIVDKVIFFIAPKFIGGDEAKTPMGGLGKMFMRDATTLKNMKYQMVGEDIMIEGYL